MHVEKDGVNKTMQELLSRQAKPDTLSLMLEQKLTAFEGFLSATLSLKERLLAGEDMEQIESLLGYRQGLMRHIDHLDSRIKNMTAHAGAMLMAEPAPGKAKGTDALSAALEEKTARVSELNEECAAIAAGCRDELGKELAGIRNGRVALRGYAGGARDNDSHGAPRLLSVNI